MPEEAVGPVRAGFWRRLGAFMTDLLIGGLVIAVLDTFAFWLSGGRVQTAPLAPTITICNDIGDLPADLAPPPPDDSNYASDCSAGSFPGLTMTRVLMVGKRVRSPYREVKTWRSYPLAADGTPIAAFDASWIGQLGFAVYVVSCLCVRGRTLGMRLLRIRVMNLAHPERIGVPLRQILVRTAVAIAGIIPTVLLGLAALAWTQHDPEHAPALTVLTLGWIATAVWIVWNIVLIGRKRDPIYDRVSGLAVVRRPTWWPTRFGGDLAQTFDPWA